MNVSFNTASSAMSAVRMASAASATRGAGAGASAASLSEGERPQGARPPPPAGGFGGGGQALSSGLSTTQFAAHRHGPPPGGDPVASLDTDGDGSVSGQEFGLDDSGASSTTGSSSASTALKDLFKAMDQNGDGGLSTHELDSFRESFVAQMDPRAGQGSAMPPPPPGGGGGDARSFVEQLAQTYASWQSDSVTATSGRSLYATA